MKVLGFDFQGSREYEFELPENVKKVTFEIGPNSTLYDDVNVQIPTITEIECYEERKKED